jgi:hypothetical protein
MNKIIISLALAVAVSSAFAEKQNQHNEECEKWEIIIINDTIAKMTKDGNPNIIPHQGIFEECGEKIKGYKEAKKRTEQAKKKRQAKQHR